MAGAAVERAISEWPLIIVRIRRAFAIASELAEAERKPGQTLAARSFLEPVGDSRETSAA